jgi:hypothetical protein
MWLARTFDASLRRVGPPAWVPLAAQFGELRAGVAGGGNLVTLEAGGRALAVYLDRAFHGPRSPGQPVFGSPIRRSAWTRFWAAAPPAWSA